MPLAKNALRKLRTTRHPDILKFIDVVENENTIYIVTERVRPLALSLRSWKGTPQSKAEWLTWGLHRISVRDTYAI
jgi:SCY1-like protein 1